MSEIETVQVTIEVPKENGVVSMSKATAAIILKGLHLAAEVLHAAKDEEATEQMIEARDFIYGMYDHCWGEEEEAEQKAAERLERGGEYVEFPEGTSLIDLAGIDTKEDQKGTLQEAMEAITSVRQAIDKEKEGE